MAENVLFNPPSGVSVPPISPSVPPQPVSAGPKPVSSYPSQGSSVVPPPVQPKTTSVLRSAGTASGAPKGIPGQPKKSMAFSGSNLVKIAVGLFVFLIIVILAYIFIARSASTIMPNKVTLTYWGIWEDSKIMQPVIDAFEKQHPNITINYEEQDIKKLAAAKQPYPTRLLARVSSGEGPDIFRFHNSWYPMLSKVLAPFPSDVITTQQYSNTFFPVVSSDLVHNGAIYGVPIDFDTLALFTNPEFFKNGVQVPQDWNDFYATAQSLTVKGTDGTITTAGAAMGNMGNVSHATDILALLLADSDVDTANIAGSSDNAGKALLYFTNFANGTGAVWDAKLPISLQMFAKGNMAMYIGYSWDIFNIQALNRSLQFEVHPIPSLFGTKRTVANYWAEGVSVGSKHPKEAMMFMKFLLQKDTQQLFYSSAAKVRGIGEPYARQDLADTLKTNKLIYPFEEQGSVAVSSPFISDTFDMGINNVSNSYLINAVNSVTNLASPDNASVQSIVTALSNGMRNIYQQYGQ